MATEDITLGQVAWGLIRLIGKGLAVLGAVLGILWIASAFTVGFPLAKTPEGKITVVVGGGFFEPSTVESIRYSSDGVYFRGWYDKSYNYPTTQRSYVVALGKGEQDSRSPDSIVPSRDGVQMQFETAAYFKLNQDLVADFHEEIGIKTNAWTDKGWDRMLDQYFRKIEQDTIRNFARKYTVDELYCPDCSSEREGEVDDLLVQAEQQIGASLKEDLARAQGGEYFCGPDSSPSNCTDIQFVINNIQPANSSVLAKYAELRTSTTEIDIQRKNVRAATLEAKAARELTEQGTLSDQYVRLRYVDALNRAVETGNVGFWVLNGQENVTIPGPPKPAGRSD